ncbi:sulfatase-like hydrolase/transferase [Rhizobium sp. LjRoot254]|uniref:sulfatase-like hydrolase/transferase n=1 Tax=Rhizobium sp. LjRoot254 TaxID=3342297 RepID=UPI003ECE4ED6
MAPADQKTLAGRLIQMIRKVALHPVTVIILGLAFFAIVRYLDTRQRYLLYTGVITLALSSLFFLLSRRLCFSLYAGGAVTMLLAVASVIKYQLKGMALHAYDFIFMGSDSSVLDFLVSAYLSLFVSGLLVLVGVLVLLGVIWRVEKPLLLSWIWRAPLPVIFTALAVLLYPAKRPLEEDYLPFIDGYNGSALYISLGQVSFPLDKLNFGVPLDTVKIDTPFENTVTCKTGPQPDFYLVLSESQTVPTYYKEITAPEELLTSYRSGDDKVHPLYVETFGGGTWVTNFSVMTGLSTFDFGVQAPYVTQLMEGRVKGALPDVLARCGYRTVTIMPMNFNFVGEGLFLKSIGFQEIYDAEAMGIETHGIRDEVYFAFARKLIAEHRAKDKRPLFLSIQTLFPHGGYDSSLVPESELSTVFASNAHANEYMRRMAVARRDLGAFSNWLKADPGLNGSVLAEYGDHQSEATKVFAEAKDKDGHLFSDPRSDVYKTFFTLHGFGTPIDYTMLKQAEDVGFLSARLIKAAGLSTSPVFEDLLRLSDLCAGRYFSCVDHQDELDRHLKKRVDAGMLRVN